VIDQETQFDCECGHSLHKLRICNAYRDTVSLEVMHSGSDENILSRIASSAYYVFAGKYPEAWATFIIKKRDIPRLVKQLQEYEKEY